MAGRPTKLTKAIADKIFKTILGGNYLHVAAEHAGIGVRTLRDWMRLGKQRPNSEYGNFRRGVIEAEKQAELNAVAIIRKAAKKDAKHAQWWLERKLPDRWGRRDRLELSGNKKKPITEVHEIVVATREEAKNIPGTDAGST